mgnify:CR=1 FL=1
MNNNTRFSHTDRQIAKQTNVQVVLPFFHQSLLEEDFSENRVFVDSAILDTRITRPCNALMLSISLLK